MTTLENLELLYKQYSRLSKEIDSMIEQEDYEAAIEKINYKTELTKKMAIAKKTTQLTDKEKEYFGKLEENFRVIDEKNINFLIGYKEKLGEELRHSRKRVKISSAYDVPSDKKNGILVDLSE